MKKFYLTFGQKYRREKHPVWIDTETDMIHPDGYWLIKATSEEEAREKVCKILGIYWCGLYEKEPDIKLYPLGEIGKIE